VLEGGIVAVRRIVIRASVLFFQTTACSCRISERPLQILRFFCFVFVFVLIRMVHDPWRAEEEEGYVLILERFWVEGKIIEHMIAMYVYVLYDVTLKRIYTDRHLPCFHSFTRSQPSVANSSDPDPTLVESQRRVPFTTHVSKPYQKTV